jgi:cytochrome P450 family 9
MTFNKEVQQELQSEIDSVLAELDGKPVGYEALHKMKFLDMVVSEGLRKWPPAPQTDRTCLKDYELKNHDGKVITIKAGEVCFFPIYSLHRDEALWPNPDKFDPQRFNDENKTSIASGTYFPFGLGQRACIGENLTSISY